MPLTHEMFLKYMIKLGYNEDKEGICFGVAHMGIQALLSNDLEGFNKHLNDIEEDAKDLNNVKKHSESSTTLYDKKYADKGVTAFLEGVRLYYKPQTYPDLFENGKAPIGQNALLTFPLVMSSKIKEQNGLYRSTIFSGVYNEHELTNYFTSLKESIENTKPDYINPVALVLSSINHSVSVGFDPSTRQWILIDANRLPVMNIASDKEIAKAVIKSFDTSAIENVIFSTEVYATNDNRKSFDPIIENWKNKPSLKKMHEVSSEKVDFKGIYDASWLFLAARDGSLNVVKELLENPSTNPNINIARKDGMTPLLTAVKQGHLEIVEELLNCCLIEPDKAMKNGLTPLLFAVINEDLSMVATMLKLGKEKINPNKADKDKMTPLLAAVVNRDLPMVTELLNHPLIDPNIASDDGITPFHSAAEYGRLDIVQELMNHPLIDPNKASDDGMTPFLIAVKYGRLNVVQELLNNPKIVPNLKKALKIANKRGHSDVVAELKKHKIVKTHENVKSLTNLEKFELLLKNGNIIKSQQQKSSLNFVEGSEKDPFLNLFTRSKKKLKESKILLENNDKQKKPKFPSPSS